jgi:hypothetical protein
VGCSGQFRKTVLHGIASLVHLNHLVQGKVYGKQEAPITGGIWWLKNLKRPWVSDVDFSLQNQSIESADLGRRRPCNATLGQVKSLDHCASLGGYISSLTRSQKWVGMKHRRVCVYYGVCHMEKCKVKSLCVGFQPFRSDSSMFFSHFQPDTSWPSWASL